jgi:hypothetical protein
LTIGVDDDVDTAAIASSVFSMTFTLFFLPFLSSATIITLADACNIAIASLSSIGARLVSSVHVSYLGFHF